VPKLAEKSKRVVAHTLIPYFGKMKLDKITGEAIDKWLDYMIAEKYENSTTNGYFGTLMTMMKWAVKKRYIVRDPFLDVQKLMNEQKENNLLHMATSKRCLLTIGKGFGIMTLCCIPPIN
jgi:site-specific recombinase XerD